MAIKVLVAEQFVSLTSFLPFSFILPHCLLSRRSHFHMLPPKCRASSGHLLGA